MTNQNHHHNDDLHIIGDDNDDWIAMQASPTTCAPVTDSHATDCFIYMDCHDDNNDDDDAGDDSWNGFYLSYQISEQQVS